MNHLRQIWTLIYQSVNLSDKYEIIEIAVLITSQVMKWSTENDTFTFNNQTAMSLSVNFVSISSNVNIFPSKEECHSHENNDPIFLIHSKSYYRCELKRYWAIYYNLIQNMARQKNFSFNRAKSFNSIGSSSSQTRRFNTFRIKSKILQNYKKPKTQSLSPYKT